MISMIFDYIFEYLKLIELHVSGNLLSVAWFYFYYRLKVNPFIFFIYNGDSNILKVFLVRLFIFFQSIVLSVVYILFS